MLFVEACEGAASRYVTQLYKSELRLVKTNGCDSGKGRSAVRADRVCLIDLVSAPSVAVGTALASGPPHRSVREGLPHTALTSGSCDGQPLVGYRCRKPHPPIPSCCLSY